jgi:hypothetical protein
MSPSAKPYADPWSSPNAAATNFRPVPSLKNTWCGPVV